MHIVWAFQGQIPSVGMDWDHHQTSRHDPSSASHRCHGALVRRAARAACATPRGGAEAAWFGALEFMRIAQLKKPHNIMKIRCLSDSTTSTTNRMEFYNNTNLWLTWLASQQAIPQIYRTIWKLYIASHACFRCTTLIRLRCLVCRVVEVMVMLRNKCCSEKTIATLFAPGGPTMDRAKVPVLKEDG